eukprot:1181562-Prorocentrum_minimum.AAC.7
MRDICNTGAHNTPAYSESINPLTHVAVALAVWHASLRLVSLPLARRHLADQTSVQTRWRASQPENARMTSFDPERCRMCKRRRPRDFRRALSIHNVALNVHHVALSIHNVALIVHNIALSIRNVALSIHNV